MNLFVYYGHMKLEDFTTTESDNISGNQRVITEISEHESLLKGGLPLRIDAADRQRFYRSFMMFGGPLYCRIFFRNKIELPKKNSGALVPQANYIDRATAACRRS
jgi:hypothetical protein